MFDQEDSEVDEDAALKSEGEAVYGPFFNGMKAKKKKKERRRPILGPSRYCISIRLSMSVKNRRRRRKDQEFEQDGGRFDRAHEQQESN